MSSKKRLFTLITIVTLLALLPTAALAATISVGGVTVMVPDSRIDCSPYDEIEFIIPPDTWIEYYFYRYDVTTGFMVLLPNGYGTLNASAKVPFPYPAITGALTFDVMVKVHTSSTVFKGSKQWHITCEPPPGGEGCTPGYWRNHYASWPAAYTPATGFNAAFLIGANYYAPDFFSNSYTLGNGIWQGGGGFNRLARHGTAALLSAASPDVDYPYTVAEVIAMVQSGTVDPLAQANELGCPLK